MPALPKMRFCMATFFEHGIDLCKRVLCPGVADIGCCLVDGLLDLHRIHLQIQGCLCGRSNCGGTKGCLGDYGHKHAQLFGKLAALPDLPEDEVVPGFGKFRICCAQGALAIRVEPRPFSCCGIVPVLGKGSAGNGESDEKGEKKTCCFCCFHDFSGAAVVLGSAASL